jgi:hypothetical protein
MGGEDFIVPPLSLGSIEFYQDRLDIFIGGMSKESIALMVDVALAALIRNYPDMTRERLLTIMDVANMNDVFGAVMDVSGLRRKEAEAGEALGVSA